MQTIVADGSEGLVPLVRERSGGQPTVQELISYRAQAEESATSDENVYRIVWVSGFELSSRRSVEELDPQSPDRMVLTVRLLRKEDGSVGAEVDERQVYVASYLMHHPTEGLKREPNVPFLKR